MRTTDELLSRLRDMVDKRHAVNVAMLDYLESNVGPDEPPKKKRERPLCIPLDFDTFVTGIVQVKPKRAYKRRK